MICTGLPNIWVAFKQRNQPGGRAFIQMTSEMGIVLTIGAPVLTLGVVFARRSVFGW
jgi:hypothetical protein